MPSRSLIKLSKLPIITDWAATTGLTPVSFGTITLPEYFYRRIGGSLHFRGYFRAGTPAAAEASITLPASIKIDTSTMSAANRNILGYAQLIAGTANVFDGSTNKVAILFCDGGTPTPGSIFFGIQGASDLNFTKTNANNFASTSGGIAFMFEIPVVGLTYNSGYI